MVAKKLVGLFALMLIAIFATGCGWFGDESTTYKASGYDRVNDRPIDMEFTVTELDQKEAERAKTEKEVAQALRDIATDLDRINEQREEKVPSSNNPSTGNGNSGAAPTPSST